MLSGCLRSDLPPRADGTNHMVSDSGVPVDAGAQPPKVVPPPPITSRDASDVATEGGVDCPQFTTQCDEPVRLWHDETPSEFLAAVDDGHTLHGLSAASPYFSWVDVGKTPPSKDAQRQTPGGTLAYVDFGAVFDLVLEHGQPAVYFPHVPASGDTGALGDLAVLERSDRVTYPQPKVEDFFPKAIAVRNGRGLGVSPSGDQLDILFAQGLGEPFVRTYQIPLSRRCALLAAQAAWLDDAHWLALEGGAEPGCPWSMHWGDAMGPHRAVQVPGDDSDPTPSIVAHDGGIALFRHLAADSTLHGYAYDFGRDTPRADWQIATSPVGDAQGGRVGPALAPRFTQAGAGASGPFVVFRQPSPISSQPDALMFAQTAPQTTCSRIVPFKLAELERGGRRRAVALQARAASTKQGATYFVWVGDGLGAELLRVDNCGLVPDSVRVQ